MTSPNINMGKKVAATVRGADRAVNSTCCLNFLDIFTAMLFFAVLFMNFLAADPSKSYGLFQNGISNVSAMYPLDITPAGWTFSIWGLIYCLQFAWNLYSLALLCRRTASGPALTDPPILTAGFFAFFNVTSVLNITWLFLWDRKLLLASALFLNCQAISLYLTVGIAATRIYKFHETLIDAGRKTEYVFLNIAVLNGVSMYATWVTVASALNIGAVLEYKLSEHLSNESVSIICLSLVSICFVIYAALDFSLLEVYTRYSVAPYFTLVWALAGILSKQWDGEDPRMSSIVAAVMLGTSCLMALIKVVVSIYKVKTHAYQYQLMKSRP